METQIQSRNMSIGDYILVMSWITFVLFTLVFSLDIPESLSRIISYLTLFLSFALFSFSLLTERFSKYVLLLLVSIIIFSSLSVFDVDFTSIDSKYFIKYAKFLCMLFAWFWGSYLIINNSTVKYIFGINIALSFILIILSFILPIETLGMENPNSTATILFFNMIFNIIYVFQTRNRIIKFLCILLCIYGIFLMINTGSRSVMLASTFMLAYVFFGTKYKISKPFLLLCLIWAIAFVFFYTFLYTTGFIATDYQFLDKPLMSGREIMWIDIYESENLLVGHYSDYHTEMLHNSHFDMLVQYGLSVMLLVMAYLYKILNNLREMANSSLRLRIIFVAILSALIHGFAESAVLDGGLAIYFCIGTLSVFIRNRLGETG